MTIDKFIALTREGEHAQLEYKTCMEDVSESLYESVCSFLNHSGGHILVGVQDDGTIVGVNPGRAETLKANIINSIKNQELFLPCPYFTPQILEAEGKTVLMLDIPCGQYVYRYKGRYWDRNGDADIDVTDQPELLLSLFERKNPHLFEERFVEGLSMDGLDPNTFQYCRNVIQSRQPSHAWLQLSNEEILLSTHLATREGEKLRIKFAALLLFGTDDALAELMPRYRFEALFHMCTYADYEDMKKFPSRYDDRRTIRHNLIRVYGQLAEFVERYMPDKFYLSPETGQREDLRWNLMREVVANMLVHFDASSGYACFLHIFKDRVLTKNPTRLLPEIPEGELTIHQLSNYTKNPLLVRVFHELHWVEDLGSGVRNILRYAPLYYPNYKIEINSGQQFLFSVTYADVPADGQMSKENVPNNVEMSQTGREIVPNNVKMSQTDVKKSQTESENVPELSPEELSLKPFETKRAREKRNQRRKAIVHLMIQDSQISSAKIAEKLGINERTVKRDIKELREKGIIERIGGDYGGKWKIIKK